MKNTGEKNDKKKEIQIEGGGQLPACKTAKDRKTGHQRRSPREEGERGTKM